MKSKLETEFWKLLKPHLTGHVERIENAVGSGHPDLDITDEGLSFHIELKVCSARSYNIVEQLLPSQCVWHFKNQKEGGVVFVLCRNNDSIDLFLCRGYQDYVLLECFSKIGYSWDWKTLRNTLLQTAKAVILAIRP